MISHKHINWYFNLLIILCSIGFSLLIIEVVLRLWNPLPDVTDLHSLSVYSDTNTNNRAINESSNFRIPNKVLGWINKRNLSLRTSFKNSYDVMIHTNSKGLRSRKEFSYQKNPDTIRILILGDSYSFGVGVEDDETWPSILEEKLKFKGLNAEVINMGVAGYGTDQQYLYYKTVGTKYQADIVILGYTGTALRRNSTKFFEMAKPMFVLENEELKLIPTNLRVDKKKSTETSRKNKILNKLYFYNYLYYIKNNLNLVLTHLGYGDGYKVTEMLIRKITNAIRKENAIPLIVYIPREQEIISDLRFIYRQHEIEIGSFIENMGASYLNLAPFFRDNVKKGLYLENEMGHTNRYGNDLIATGVALEIIQLLD